MTPTTDTRRAELEAELAALDAGQPAADAPSEAERTAELFRSLARRCLAGDDLHAFYAEIDDLMGLVEPVDDEPPAAVAAEPAPPAQTPGPTTPAPRPGSPAAPGSLD